MPHVTQAKPRVLTEETVDTARNHHFPRYPTQLEGTEGCMRTADREYFTGMKTLVEHYDHEYLKKGHANTPQPGSWLSFLGLVTQKVM
jgi:truncated hemoglobin YjbI